MLRARRRRPKARLIMGGPGEPQATEYFVDATGGDDSNSGRSPTLAWQTIGKVNGESYIPTDRILFKRGEVWREKLVPPSSGTISGSVVFGAYGSGNDPIINGSDLVTTWSDEGGNVWSAALTTNPTHVFFDDVRGTQETAQGNLNAAREWYWNANVLYVYSTSDPDTAYVAPGIEAAVRSNSLDVVSKDYITIENLHVTKSQLKNIRGSGSDYCSFLDLEADGAALDGIELNDCDHCVIVYGNYHHNGTPGTDPDVSENLGAGVLISNGSVFNTVRGVESNNNQEDGVALGGAVLPGSGHVIVSCNLHDNSEDGIDIKKGDQTVTNNTVEDNSEYGLVLHDTAGTVTLEGNSFDGNELANVIVIDSGIIESTLNYYGAPVAGDNASVHCTVNDGPHLFYYDIFVGGVKRQLQIENGTAHEVYNCVFYNPSSGAFALVRFTANADNAIVKNCAFYGNGLHCLRFEAGSVVGASDHNSFYRSDSASNWVYVNDTSYDQSDIDDGTIFTDKGTEENSITGDPLWTDPGNDDFTLQSGSGCRNAGANVGLSEDRNGVSVPQETNPAIGAYEYI